MDGRQGQARGARWLWLLSLLLLMLNDQLLKGAGLLPGWLTGKLSDFAGLLLAPPLLALGLVRLGLPRRRASALACALVAAGFAALQLSPAFARAFDACLGAPFAALSWPLVSRTVADPGDLLALAMLPLAYRIGVVLRLEPGLSSRLLLSAAAAGCCATSVWAVEMMPHWGFAGELGERTVQPFDGGVLDLRMGKISVEGSFELGLVLHASGEPVALDLRAVEALLGEARVGAQLALGDASVLRATPEAAVAARMHFLLPGPGPAPDTDFEDIPEQRGHLRVPVEVAGQRRLVIVPLHYRARMVLMHDRARFHDPREVPR